jgi:hypothetical protein
MLAGARIKTCRNCLKRTPGCHATCMEGIQQDRERKERQAKIEKERNKDHGYMAYKTQAVVPKAKWP